MSTTPSANSKPEAQRPRRVTNIQVVCLLGFMGAGKSTIGRALARRMGWRFADLDQVIEVREHRSIEEIFRQGGEPGFRASETAALLDLLPTCLQQPTILALGGGTFTQPENAKALRAAGTATVFLNTPFEKLWERCSKSAAKRPLLQDKESFRKLYRQRLPHYTQADVVVSTAGKEMYDVAYEIAMALGL